MNFSISTINFLLVLLALLITSVAPASEKNANTYSSVRTCVKKAQQKSLLYWQNANASFANCSSLNDELSLGRKSEVFSTETDQVALALHTVSNCFNIPYQSVFAKFYAESGLQSNIVGKSKDAGFGQLTSLAIKDVQDNSHIFWRQIQYSKNPFCQDLKDKIKSVGYKNFFHFPAKQKCQVIYDDIGILRNIFFSFALHKLNFAYVTKSFKKFHISEKLSKSGLVNPPIDKMIQMLTLLSYNNGGDSSVADLSRFLDSRIDFIKRKDKEPRAKNLTSNQQAQFIGEVNYQDFNFRTGSEKFSQLVADIVFKFPDKKMDLVFQSKELRNTSASKLGFPEWLRIWQSNGGPGYMNGIFLKSEDLKKSGLSDCINDVIFNL